MAKTPSLARRQRRADHKALVTRVAKGYKLSRADAEQAIKAAANRIKPEKMVERTASRWRSR